MRIIFRAGIRIIIKFNLTFTAFQTDRKIWIHRFSEVPLYFRYKCICKFFGDML